MVFFFFLCDSRTLNILPPIIFVLGYFYPDSYSHLAHDV